MKRVTEWIEKIKRIEQEHLLSAAAILLCGLCVIVFLGFYFDAWGQPYMADKITDLSEGWEYETESTERTSLATLRSGPQLAGGETMTMYRTLDKEITNAAILIRANHQTVNVYLDGAALYLDRETEPGGNPGIRAVSGRGLRLNALQLQCVLLAAGRRAVLLP